MKRGLSAERSVPEALLLGLAAIVVALGLVGARAALYRPGPVRAEANVDVTRLPIGDGRIASGPETGSVWSCATAFGGGGAFTRGPWIRDDGTFDLTAKATVDGEIRWQGELVISLSDDRRVVSGNGLPDHPTGEYPISRTDDAYQYDRNPNSIRAQRIQISLPATPALAEPSCLPMGAIGIMRSGSVFFNALDAPGRDAVAHENQDACHGHPERSGAYHYHSLTPCLADNADGHSALLGYAYDGFGLFGVRGEGGQLLANADLDECHGHSHQFEWDGQHVELYHYHATWEYPYTLGCYRGTPIARR